ncbi:amino acid adenylation domain-containing protein, partial [Sphingobacterium siyangense]|uniref:amino acid adenylation domain-containing protein n=8 Tax=Sphingobacterium TaxID=28453 RepID=UPI003DA27195
MELSPIQESILISQQIHTLSSLFNVGGYAEIKREVNIEQLRRAIIQVIDRIDVLDLIQDKCLDFNLKSKFVIEILDQSRSNNAHKLKDWLRDEMIRPIQADQTLIDVKLIVNGTSTIWYVKTHHLIFDGFSMSLFFRNVLNFYNKRLSNVDEIEIIIPSFKDTLKSFDLYKSSEQYIADRNFWKERNDYASNEKIFPALYRNNDLSAMSAKRIEYSIDSNLVNDVAQFCENLNISPYNYFLGVFFVTAKVYGNSFVNVGLPISNRYGAKEKQVFGPMVNILPLQFELDLQLSFSNFLLNLKKELLTIYRHKRYPLKDMLVDKDEKGNLFNTFFSYQTNKYEVDFEMDGWNINYLHNGQQEEEFAFHLLDLGRENELKLLVDYKDKMFDRDSVIILIENYIKMISTCCTSWSSSIENIISQYTEVVLLPQQESFYTENLAAIDNEPLIQVLDGQLQKFLDAKVFFQDRSCTFDEISVLSNQFANFLTGQIGFSANSNHHIGVSIQRTDWIVIAILGILRTGATYVPIDPSFPQDRVNYILADCDCSLLITDDLLADFITNIDTYSKSYSCNYSNVNNIAYIIYTSGSTGAPKGVQIGQSSVVSFLAWCKQEFNNSNFDVIFSTTSINFDLSVFELFCPLILGKDLRIIDTPLLTSIYLDRHLNILLNTVPSLVGSFIDNGFDFNNISVLNIAGEPIPKGILDQLDLKRIEVRNLYGPTEDTTYSTCYRIHDPSQCYIGRPIDNTQVYILGSNASVQPIGAIGEICLGGAGLAVGYLNLPNLTNERFISNPYCEGQLMYRTGDLGRWMVDGNIDYLGRIDEQLKIRGYRIEPGEVETVLMQYDGITSAVVIPRESTPGDINLAACLVTSSDINLDALRDYLYQYLPQYMVPTHYMYIDSVPLTPNGKVDRKALLSMTHSDIHSDMPTIPPEGQLESLLASAWADILNIDIALIGRNSNFFDLGGHSLRAVRLSLEISKKMLKRFDLRDVFACPILHEMAYAIEISQPAVQDSIPVINENNNGFEVSFGQRRLWAISQFNQASAAYNLSAAYNFEGILDWSAIEVALEKLVEKNDVLRTLFKLNSAGELRQYILQPNEVKLDIRKYNVENELNDLDQHISAFFRETFNLEQAGLFRIGLFRIDARNVKFCFSIHHIICDGWSMKILLNDLISFYNEHKGYIYSARILEKIQYKDYAAWHNNLIRSEKGNFLKAFWMEELEGIQSSTEILGDLTRPKIKTYNGRTYKKEFLVPRIQTFQEFLNKNSSSLFMGLLALVKVLIFKYSGKSDLVIGTPVIGRTNANLQGLIGLCANTTTIRSFLDPEKTFVEFLNDVKHKVLNVYDYQEYPFDLLLDDLKVERDVSRHPIFDIQVILEDKINANDFVELRNIVVTEYEHEIIETSRFDLVFNFEKVNDNLALSLNYNSDIYSEHFIGRLVCHLSNLLDQILIQPGVHLGKLNVVNDQESREIIWGFNPVPEQGLPKMSLLEIIKSYAIASPTSIAVSCQGEDLSYSQLLSKVDALANFLSETISFQDKIAVVLDRSEFSIISFLAIQSVGAIYVPIDPQLPKDRIEFILKDIDTKLIITHSNYLFDLAFFNGSLIALDIQLEVFDSVLESKVETQPSDISYIIYTSGSTGVSKGVLVEHRGIRNTIVNQINSFTIAEKKRHLQFASHSFDASISEILMCLCTGGELYIIDELSKSDPFLLSQYLNSNQIQIATFPPTIITMLNYKLLGDLEIVISAGEAFRFYSDASKTKIKFFNAYGPTEASICSTVYAVSDFSGRVPIGRPIGNTQVYILGPGDCVQPIGAVGEICLGGAGLARGYLNLEELTTSRFVANPHVEGALMYRTGDLGRWLSDGNVDFLGRMDEQLKIRGYRVEPGEIESVLMGFDGVSAAVVLAREN